MIAWVNLICFVMLTTSQTLIDLEMIRKLEDSKKSSLFRKELTAEQLAEVDRSIDAKLSSYPPKISRTIDRLAEWEVPLLEALREAESFVAGIL
jgi:hypothetical protein